jgi:hypothetical protein
MIMTKDVCYLHRSISPVFLITNIVPEKSLPATRNEKGEEKMHRKRKCSVIVTYDGETSSK